MIDLSYVTPTKPTLEQQLSVDTVIPEKAQVTHQESLDLMIKVYSFCINGSNYLNLFMCGESILLHMCACTHTQTQRQLVSSSLFHVIFHLF